MKKLFRDPYFYLVLLIQITGTYICSKYLHGFLNGFGLWANVIQVMSAFALYHLLTIHRRDIHEKIDALHERFDNVEKLIREK